MELPTVTIDLVVDRSSCRDVLKGTIHAILFHRAFGTIKPKTFQVMDVTMPYIADPETETWVQDKVDLFWKGIETGASKRGQVSVVMSEKKPKKSWFSMGGEEDVPWEFWHINVELKQPKDTQRADFETRLSAILSKALMTMITYSTSEAGRKAVPLISDATGISPFPIRIVVKIGGIEVGA
ncbi:hypothetical protein CYLTODRAFT_420076 [Cylindrobasidium torrendii FP15055 ss-10]|uniref:Autophagy-related protein 101 n=1 Tax=Cylindrobasidium torrendii FP15055 ss-10 TaxID=1314674 RepID=A0A0D7BHR2_9AGAR|nr:hypothetical protein CYLTODRAFT_420076 [Cylindrobasidium torrendii FP15055 ss-10]